MQSFTSFQCSSGNKEFNKHSYEYDSHALGETSTVIDRNKIINNIILKCKVCKCNCHSTTDYEAHMRGRRHARRLNKANLLLNCNEETYCKSVLKIEDTTFSNTTDNVILPGVDSLSKDDSIKSSFPFTNGDVVKETEVLNEIVKMKSTNIDEIPTSTIYGEVVQETEVVPGEDSFCKDCSLELFTKARLEYHLSGAKHLKTVKRKKFLELKALRDPSVFCDICKKFLIMDEMEGHRKGIRHLRKSLPKEPAPPVSRKINLAILSTTDSHCAYCKLDFSSPSEATEHYASLTHEMNAPFSCSACQLIFADYKMLDIHLKGFAHFATVNRDNPKPEGVMGLALMERRRREKTKRKVSNNIVLTPPYARPKVACLSKETRNV